MRAATWATPVANAGKYRTGAPALASIRSVYTRCSASIHSLAGTFSSDSAKVPTSGDCPWASGPISCDNHGGQAVSPACARRNAASGAPPAAASHSRAGSTFCARNHCNAVSGSGAGSGKRRHRDTRVGSRRSGARWTTPRSARARDTAAPRASHRGASRY
ncbi:hypothetical protein G6F22_018015 [Rhizopus arrhizus]|nr:hypothetical protein G6F22_018015 [Rhizopus arrhizus]